MENVKELMSMNDFSILISINAHIAYKEKIENYLLGFNNIEDYISKKIIENNKIVEIYSKKIDSLSRCCIIHYDFSKAIDEMINLLKITPASD
jgi:hypothetical protein